MKTVNTKEEALVLLRGNKPGDAIRFGEEGKHFLIWKQFDGTIKQVEEVAR